MNNQSLKLLRDKFDCPELDNFDNIFPVKVGGISEQLGINISILPIAPDMCGRMYIKDNRYHFEVNTRHNPAQMRKTVACFLGHYCLHKDFFDSVGFFLKRTSKSTILRNQEIEAELFARELLMPEEHFIKKYTQSKNLREVADYFITSLSEIQSRASFLIRGKTPKTGILSFLFSF